MSSARLDHSLFDFEFVSDFDIRISDFPSRHLAAQPARGRQVALLHVVGHHAVGAEPPAQGADGVHHPLDPVPRQTVDVAIVEQRNHLLAQDAVQIGRVAGVGDAVVDVLRALADGKAVGAVEGLGPPAVEDREVQGPVEHGLLAAGAGGLQRPPRIVQPDVDALDQVPADVDVVVLDEDHALGEAGVEAEVGDPLDQLLARLVGGVGLAGEDELHRPLRIVDHLGHAVDVVEEQVGPLVGGEPPGEADGEDVRIEDVPRGLDHFVALAAAAALAAEPAADEGQHQVLQGVVRFPKLARIDVVDALPDLRIAEPGHPAGLEVAVVKLHHLVGQPGGNVDAVGDVADGDLLLRPPRPEMGPHPPRDVAVQVAHGVGPPRELQPQHGHAERLVLVLRLDAAQAHQLLEGDAQLVAQRDQGAPRSGCGRSGRGRPARACAW